MRQKNLLWACAVVPVAAALLAVVSCARPVRVGPDWTPQRLQQELAKAGRHYEGKRYLGGLILKRAEDATPWEELEELVAGHPRLLRGRRGVLWVTTFGNRLSLVREHSPGVIDLAPLTIRGHPDDLAELEELFGP